MERPFDTNTPIGALGGLFVPLRNKDAQPLCHLFGVRSAERRGQFRNTTTQGAVSQTTVRNQDPSKSQTIIYIYMYIYVHICIYAYSKIINLITINQQVFLLIKQLAQPKHKKKRTHRFNQKKKTPPARLGRSDHFSPIRSDPAIRRSEDRNASVRLALVRSASATTCRRKGGRVAVDPPPPNKRLYIWVCIFLGWPGRKV